MLYAFFLRSFVFICGSKLKRQILFFFLPIAIGITLTHYPWSGLGKNYDFLAINECSNAQMPYAFFLRPFVFICGSN